MMLRRIALGLCLATCSQLGGCFFFYVRSAPTQAQAPAVNRETLTACRDYDRARRVGTFADEQAAKREMDRLSLGERDCAAIVKAADS